MSSFTDGAWWPTGRTINGRAELCIIKPFRFYIASDHVPEYVDVPDGFVFDGASIPHWSRYFLPVGKIEVPAAVHDVVRRNVSIPLKVGDKIFLKAMLAYGTPRWAAYVCYIAVGFNKKRR